MGRILGLSHQEAIDSLGRFEGTLRRFQLITDTAGIRVYDDYAHHPTEIRAALTAARRATAAGNEATGLQGRLIACFQPHLYSRTVDFSDEFGQVMTLADVAVINDVDGAREDPVPGVTGELVVDAAIRHGAKDVVYVKEKYDLPAALDEIARPGDLIITLGCGDVTIVGPLLADLLKQRPDARTSRRRPCRRGRSPRRCRRSGPPSGAPPGSSAARWLRPWSCCSWVAGWRSSHRCSRPAPSSSRAPRCSRSTR